MEKSVPKKKELKTTNYEQHKQTWPQKGRHILAQHDHNSVVVYQAYNPLIGLYASSHSMFFGAPGFGVKRMTWIKTNFMWMMYRSGWGSKPNQEVILAIWIKKEVFEKEILGSVVHAGYTPEVYKSKEEWKETVKNAEVKMQWDPDHLPDGNKSTRRAIQLGIKGEKGRKYASGEWFIDIQDISDFVREQRAKVESGDLSELQVPEETVFEPQDQKLCKWLGVGEFSELGLELHEAKKRAYEQQKAMKEKADIEGGIKIDKGKEVKSTEDGEA
eukprot:CAMPEP_0174257854 /NCGR_PEP_ID=MMETSP0439-20130205/6961_1 /TAXON_ID=0 /ORGANISM="Stereomyxa ramosa, Strain Chinc5" /LENGTH=272 /DNA_ID=CAMNT_0015341139 /DNA_START=103 /DNA_END=921 /DNA_ORIENTATION=+